MVSASQPLAALVGIDVLKAGATVVDAAIATNAALGLMEPANCGIGATCSPSCGASESGNCTASTRAALPPRLGAHPEPGLCSPQKLYMLSKLGPSATR